MRLAGIGTTSLEGTFLCASRLAPVTIFIKRFENESGALGQGQQAFERRLGILAPGLAGNVVVGAGGLFRARFGT